MYLLAQKKMRVEGHMYVGCINQQDILFPSHSSESSGANKAD